MRENGIICSGSSVRAILEGRKTQTRRPIKPQGNILPECWDACNFMYSETGHSGKGWYVTDDGCEDDGSYFLKCPYGQPGDRLWVREKWQAFEPHPDKTIPIKGPMKQQPAICLVGFAATETQRYSEFGGEKFKGPWRPSIFMPRWASRILLEIVSVRVERLQVISEDDAKAEGLKAITKDGQLIKWGLPDADGLPSIDNDGWPWDEWCVDPRKAYQKWWNSIYGPRAWDRNEWVWVVEFRVLEAKP